MDRQMCTSGRYCYFKTSRQSCDDGKPQYTFMKFTSMCSRCQLARFTFTIGSLMKSKCTTIVHVCSRIIYPGATYPRYASHLKFSECGQNRTCSGVGKKVGPGCYCENGYVLNATTGLCQDKSTCPEFNPKIPLNLKIPGCVKLGSRESVVVAIAWEVDAERMYTYTIRSSGVVRKNETLAGKTDLSKNFNVVGQLGTLTIPFIGLGPGQYSIEVEDIDSDEKNVETGNFSIKVGCKAERDLNITPSTTLPSMQPTSTGQSAITIVMAVLIAVFIGCIVLITAIFLCWRRRQKKLFRIQEFSLKQATTIAGRQSFSFLPQQADKWELTRSDFQIDSKIGSGNFGTVFRGMLSLTANSVTIRAFKEHMMVQGKSVQSVAIKVLKDTSSKECVETFLTEIDMMKRVSRGNNAHVVKMVGCITMSVPLALVLEFVSEGNLRDYLRSAGNAHCKDSVKSKDNDGNSDGLDRIDSVDKCSITEQHADQNADPDMDLNQHHDSNDDSDEVQKAEDDLDQVIIPDWDQRTEEDGTCDVAESDLISFAYQLADGMQYLSSLGVLHRDLACRNILVDESKVLKIADFGLARNTEEYVSSMKDKLPLRWMSPETFHTGTFSEKSDVWSYGVCLWEIFSMGSLPFKDLQNAAIVPQILAGYRLQKPKNCPDHIYSIMTQCWNDKPEERPTFTTLHSKFEDLVSSLVALEYLRLDSLQEDCNL